MFEGAICAIKNNIPLVLAIIIFEFVMFWILYDYYIRKENLSNPFQRLIKTINNKIY